MGWAQGPEDGALARPRGPTQATERVSAQSSHGQQACVQSCSFAWGPAYKRPSKAAGRVCQLCAEHLMENQNKAGLHEAAAFSPASARRAAGNTGLGLRAPRPLSPPSAVVSPPPSGGPLCAGRPGRSHRNNSCKCEGSGDKERSGQQLGDSCRQTILDVKCVPLTKVLI